jgi:branched-chain amino acid transport system substrate-binding protein
LFADVLPTADSFAPADVADAALRTDLPQGSLPNGSGLRFGAPGTAEAGDNVAAASVIWEWVSPGQAAVIWPEAFATEPVDPTTSDAW